MRKLFSLLAVLGLGTVAHAQADQLKTFDCVDKQTFEVNSQCMADKISHNMTYRNVQMEIADKANVQSDAIMATIKYYPKDALIEVVAHRDALTDQSLTAAVQQ
ncbi:hypothetical protein [Aliiglaciecola lipolytica]|uniref:Soluble pyridine nucleotide transhydrogenase n=1 Tax=Aliiglaciecola lipolytica E3 TaxID=1127673 RepID=K6YCP3_9ALTE|nr:hypothetical protein [Aliiglaciecola lipolytica]GAC15962.1 hypothetical protein GLIP_3348 [Aliiglaciecola lipolytica E3]